MQLQLSEAISKALADLNFQKLTPVQAHAIPLALAGEDLIVQAYTGTGKTAAFAIPILEKTWDKPQVQTLVLAPTRELALQVGSDFKKIGKYKDVEIAIAYGGASMEKQLDSLRRGAQVVVGTPGRVFDLIERRELDLSHVQFLVLDEADVMLDMGFVRDVERIMSFTPHNKQVMLFCVDIPDGIMSLAKKHLRYPKHVKLITDDKSAKGVVQHLYSVPQGKKLAVLIALLREKKPTKALIFCRMKRGVSALTRQLQANGIDAQEIQGDLSQAQRERTMNAFKSGDIHILIATDIAARGIHVDHLSHVFNYELPDDIGYYLHRIGRTGRMYSIGEANTLCYPPEFETLKKIELMIGKKLVDMALPAELPDIAMPPHEERHAEFRGGPRGGFGGRGGRPFRGGGGGGRGGFGGGRGFGRPRARRSVEKPKGFY